MWPVSRPGVEEESEELRREVLYSAAVANFRLKNYSSSRSTLKSLLSATKGRGNGMRQAEALLAQVEHEMVREGLIGASVLTGVVAAAVGIGLSFLTSKR